MTHPHRLHATAALHSVRRALEHHLPEHRETILIRRPQLGPAATRPRSLAELEAYDELLRTERVSRRASAYDGTKVLSGPAPIPPGLLDLERETLQDVADVAQMLGYAHWSRRPHGTPDQWIAAHGYRASLWAWIAAALDVTAVDLAAAAAEMLVDADTRLRAVIGVGPDHWRLPGAPACPACGRRMLRAQTSTADTSLWTVLCTAGCVCHGAACPDGPDCYRCAPGTDDEPVRDGGCPCGMPTRARGVRHIWSGQSPMVVEALRFASAAA